MRLGGSTVDPTMRESEREIERYGVLPVRADQELQALSDLAARVFEKGLTLVPLDLHFRNGYAKVTIAVARGKRKYDKREAIKRREMDREADRHAGRR